MIELSIYNFLSVSIGSIFFTGFYTPIQATKDALLERLPDSYLQRQVLIVLNCSKCLSLIVSAILFLDIRVALVCSLFTYFINHLIDRVEAWYQ